MTAEQQKYLEIVQTVASKLNLPVEVVDRTYKAYWKFIRHTLSSLPLKGGLTEDQYKELRTSINVPSLGKFTCSWEHYLRLQKRLEYVNYLKEKV